MPSIVESFKRVYSGENASIVHSAFFIVSCLLACASVGVKSGVAGLGIGRALLIFLAILIFYFYMFGYNLLLIGNVLIDSTGKGGVLPDVNGQPFLSALKGTSFFVVWSIIFIIFGLLNVLLFFIPIVGAIISFIITLLYSLGFVYVWIAYVRNLNAKGLFNMFLPIRLGGLFIVDTIGYAIKIFGLGVVLGLPFIAMGAIEGFPNYSQPAPMMEYIVKVLATYIGFIYGFAGYIYLGQVFLEKECEAQYIIDPEYSAPERDEPYGY